MRIDEHRFEPLVVARTLWSRAASGAEGLVLKENEDELRVETPSLQNGSALFCLRQEKARNIFMLQGLDEILELSKESLEAAEPDPLWESAHGICSHMEKDHGDTFGSFMAWRGWEGPAITEISMPWVDKSGFVLAPRGSQANFLWVPFLEESPTPNDVRKSMIKMLKVIRNEAR